MREELQLMWYKEIEKPINIQDISACILYSGTRLVRGNSYKERETKTNHKLLHGLKELKCTDDEVIAAFEEYGETLKEIYFNIGLRIGICVEAELVLKEDCI